MLSWNINGSPSKGQASVRNRLVPSVTWDIDPDVLLLQETKTDVLVNNIKRALGKSYIEVCAPNKAESRILYDSYMFTAIPHDYPIFPGQDGKYHSLKEILDESLRRAFPYEEIVLRGRVARGMRGAVRDRTSIVALKMCGDPDRRIIVFMSFHNLHKVPEKKNKFM